MESAASRAASREEGMPKNPNIPPPSYSEAGDTISVVSEAPTASRAESAATSDQTARSFTITIQCCNGFRPSMTKVASIASLIVAIAQPLLLFYSSWRIREDTDVVHALIIVILLAGSAFGAINVKCCKSKKLTSNGSFTLRCVLFSAHIYAAALCAHYLLTYRRPTWAAYGWRNEMIPRNVLVLLLSALAAGLQLLSLCRSFSAIPSVAPNKSDAIRKVLWQDSLALHVLVILVALSLSKRSGYHIVASVLLVNCALSLAMSVFTSLKQASGKRFKKVELMSAVLILSTSCLNCASAASNSPFGLRYYEMTELGIILTASIVACQCRHLWHLFWSVDTVHTE